MTGPTPYPPSPRVVRLREERVFGYRRWPWRQKCTVGSIERLRDAAPADAVRLLGGAFGAQGS